MIELSPYISITQVDGSYVVARQSEQDQDSLENKIRELFLSSFTKSYENAFEADCRFETIEAFLGLKEKSFKTTILDNINEEIEEWKKGAIEIALYFEENQLKGFASFDRVKEFGDKKFIYGRQGALDPSCWGKGLLPSIFKAIPWEMISPNADTLLVLVRKINRVAIEAYVKLGFKEDPSLSPINLGYDPLRYLSFCFSLKN